MLSREMLPSDVGDSVTFTRKCECDTYIPCEGTVLSYKEQKCEGKSKPQKQMYEFRVLRLLK